MTLNTDSPIDDSLDAADDDSASPSSCILDFSLKRKTSPKSMIKLKKLNDSK